MLQGLEEYNTIEGTVLEVRRGSLKLALSKGDSDRIEACPSGSVWRMDKYAPETTFQRQLQVRDPFGFRQSKP
jgi:hypothetical protein